MMASTSRQITHRETRSLLSLLDIALLVSPDIVPHFLVLLEQQPEHPIHFLGRMNGHLRMRSH